MYFVKVSLLVVAMVGFTKATGYGGGAGSGIGGYGGGAGSGGYSSGSSGVGYSSGGSAGGFGGASGFNQNAAPEPYKFEYQAADEQGNVHYRTEEGDASGSVKGTYGYTDTQGLYRVVEYVADAGGYRANIRTNEPGTDGKESPADVKMTVEQAPAGIQGGGGARAGRSGFGGSAGASNYGGGAASGIGSGVSSGAIGGGAGGFGSSGSGFKPSRGGAGVRSGKSGY